MLMNSQRVLCTETVNHSHDFRSRLFGGLIGDLRRRAPHYLSDFKDALHVQCCASFVFLYFACLTPIITFGGLLSQATGGYLVRTLLLPLHHVFHSA